MTSQTPDMQALLERLEKLERAVATMAEERASFRVVEANVFVLKDSKGRVRARLGMVETEPENQYEWEETPEARASLTLYDDQGQPRADLREGVLIMGKGDDHRVMLAAFEKAGALLHLIEGPEREPSVVSLWARKDGPQIGVEDAQGNKTVIGNMYAGWLTRQQFKDLTDRRGSGASKQDFSAASLSIIDGDGKVIWRAP